MRSYPTGWEDVPARFSGRDTRIKRCSGSAIVSKQFRDSFGIVEKVYLLQFLHQHLALDCEIHRHIPQFRDSVGQVALVLAPQ